MRIGLRAVGAVTTALALAITTPAYAAPVDEPAPDEPAAACLEDVKYLYRAHRGNLAEQAAAEAAFAGTQNERIHEIARMLDEDHTAFDRTVTALAEEHDVTLPPRPNQKQRDDLAAVVALRGPEFDAGWLELQVAAHKQTLDHIGRVREGGCAQDVRDAAEKAEPVVTSHLRAVEEASEPSR
jgi:putative membrane protein